MSQLTGVMHSYLDNTKREDLLDRIADVSPDKNYLSTIFGTSEAVSTSHNWKEYYQARPSVNTVTVEGDDNTFSDLAVPADYNNICQIIKEVFAVTRTAVKMAKVSPKDAYAREEGWAMRRYKNREEYAMLRGTKASGSSGVGREMDGLISFTIQKGAYTARASGTSLSEDRFRYMMTTSWNTTDEQLVDLLLTTGTRKSDFGRFFTTSTPKTIPADDKRLVQALDVIETDYGSIVEIRAHKDMPASSVLSIRKDLCKKAYFDTPQHVPNGITGDNRKGHIVGELTLEVQTARPFVYETGYNL